MDFELTSEQKEFRSQLARWVNERVVPQAEELGKSEEFPWELFRELGELGYLGIKYPEEYGGSGLPDVNTYHCIFLEELSRGSTGLSSVVGMHTSTATYGVYKWGTEELKQKYLVPALSGKMVSAFALTEPNAGSDAASITTRAEKTKDGYVLNGTKMFISNGTVADFVTIAAKTDPSKGVHGISLFFVDTKSPGFSVGRKLKKLATHCSDTAEIVLEDVHVPFDYLLGEENKGFTNIFISLTEDRIMTAAQALGLGKAAYDAALRYANEREQFGRPIYNFQAVQFKLVDMLARLEQARLYTYYAAWKADRNEDITKEAAMAKLIASNTANFICQMAMSIFGGYGLMEEFPVERFLRDSYFPMIGGGSGDIMRLIVARQVSKTR